MALGSAAWLLSFQVNSQPLRRFEHRVPGSNLQPVAHRLVTFTAPLIPLQAAAQVAEGCYEHEVRGRLVSGNTLECRQSGQVFAGNTAAPGDPGADPRLRAGCRRPGQEFRERSLGGLLLLVDKVADEPSQSVGLPFRT